MARWFVNPKARRGKQHRPRVRISGHTATLGAASRYKGVITRINPALLREVGMLMNPHRRRHGRRHHYRGNPGPLAAVKGVIRNPGQTVMDGAVSVLGGYLALALPNQFLPFPGVTLMDKVLRALTRVAAGGLVIMGARKVLPRSAQAVAAGVAFTTIGSTVLDLFNTRIVVGAGDTAQIGFLPGGFSLGLGAYARPMGLGAYTRPVVPMRQRPGLAAPVSLRPRALVQHGLFGGN